MKSRTTIILALSVVLCAATLFVASSTLADPPSAADGDRLGPDGEGGEHRGLRQMVRLHMELGRYYLVDGQYDLAASHFLIVANTETPAPSPDADGLEPRADTARETGEEEGRRGRRHRRSRGDRQRRRADHARSEAYLMAAVSTYLMGDEAGAEAIAIEGQAVVPEDGEGRRRGRRGADEDDARERPNGFERFLEDPDAMAERFSGGARAMEARILEIQSQLDDNGSN